MTSHGSGQAFRLIPILPRRAATPASPPRWIPRMTSNPIPTAGASPSLKRLLGRLRGGCICRKSQQGSCEQRWGWQQLNLVPVGAMLTAANPANADPKFYRPLNDPVTDERLRGREPSHEQRVRQLQCHAIDLGTPRGALHHPGQLHPIRRLWESFSPNTQNNGSIAINPFNLRSNYGIQPTDRRHLFNIVYSIDIGNPLHATWLPWRCHCRLANLRRHATAERSEPHLR